MKKGFKLTFVILCTTICLAFFSCKKENAAAQPQKTTREKLIGKWNLISEFTNNYYNGASHYQTYPFAAGDYVEFTNAGKYIEFKSGTTETYDYGLVNESNIWLLVPGNNYELRSMTETSVQLYKKTVYSSTEYHESTLSLKK